MNRGTTRSHNIFLAAGAFFILIAPLPAFAAVQVSEVMYDAPGADTGREWIEISNIGNNSVNLFGYKLFEGGVNHSITLVAGKGTLTTLAVDESAVIANNPSKFLSDYPHYAGTLLKSSFSLSNTGETFAIKDASSSVLDSVSYSSSMGATGDGNSLHRNGDTFVAGAPNPGSVVPTKAIVKVISPASQSDISVPLPAASKAKVTKTKSKSFFTASSSKNSASVAAASAYDPVQAPASDTGSTLLTALLGLGALVVLGVGGVVYSQLSTSTVPGDEETDTTADEFDIE
jgi:hypothetical protein